MFNFLFESKHEKIVQKMKKEIKENWIHKKVVKEWTEKLYEVLNTFPPCDCKYIKFDKAIYRMLGSIEGIEKVCK